MKSANARMVVIGRLRAKPILAGQVICALLIAGLMARQARGNDAVEIVRSIVFGNFLVTLLIAAAVAGLIHHIGLWRRRATYIFHDGTRLYRGSETWPLAAIRDAILADNGLGIATVRLVVDDDSEVTRELVKVYMLADAPEAVRGGVLFAVAAVRGVPEGGVLH